MGGLFNTTTAGGLGRVIHSSSKRCGLWLLGILCAVPVLKAQDLGSWSDGPALPVIQSEFHGASIGNKIYVLGGEMQRVPENENNASDELWIYDAGTDQWSQGPDMPAPRHHVAVTVWDEKLYVMGGFDPPCCDAYPWQAGTQSNFMFDPDSNKWFTLSPIPSEFGAGMAEAFEDKIYVMGGISVGSFEARSHMFVYDPVLDTWDDTKRPMQYPREHVRGCVVDSLIYVFGGHWMGSGGQRLNQERVEAYSPKSDTWYDFGVMPNPRGGTGVTYIAGKIYVIGGEGANFSGLHAENDQFDPVTEEWDVMEPLSIGLHGHATVVLNGKIHLVGGSSPQGFNPRDWHQIYTPPQIQGCTDETAENFDRYATVDDGSCATTSLAIDANSLPVQITQIGDVIHIVNDSYTEFEAALYDSQGKLLSRGSARQGELELKYPVETMGVGLLRVHAGAHSFFRRLFFNP